ncbi:hypothetical protein SAMN05216421_1836 [Halopseudomonas xinjiangensis]|uniref:Nickel/cobalt transporter regulator n=1 Tax=Halopseudomonas xinjiangensis TaxID=487184 RepID=A0A1H1TKU5_9GAMM|nr:anti-virulence regulator CigR family protein [Halopseudomonas xinjiangensis]SDS60792.1 hypothetical protein SAMN05216421_1836 [Halopseudomonas xinjiangensis]
MLVASVQPITIKTFSLDVGSLSFGYHRANRACRAAAARRRTTMNRHRYATLSLILLTAFAGATVHAQPPRDKPGKEHGHGAAEHRDADHDRSPSISEAVIRDVLRDYGVHDASTDKLPPGIQKKLQRGKPLPPGIAKKLDPQLADRLPDYPGYEWRQAGRDLILVAVTTGIIEAILGEVF